MERKDLRNIGIIAHVDHGKTTLVDSLLKSSGVFRENEEIKDRVLDSDDIERERGITIFSKNAAISYKNTKINIIDTPGHADFGGEVERVLNMASSAILVVDAFEGPMPQTKFVLREALKQKLPIIICVNKIDRENSRPEEVVEEVFELFIDLEADESYLDSPVIYTSALKSSASTVPEITKDNMEDLLDVILEHTPLEEGDPEEDFRILISSIDYSDYIGRIGIGKVESGTVLKNAEAFIKNYNKKEKEEAVKIHSLYEFENLTRKEVDKSEFGSIVAITGLDTLEIGDTICESEEQEAIEFSKISEPTLSMTFSVNDSPFAGQDGEYVTSRQLRSRLYRELETDVSLRVEDGETTESFRVYGRGELHLSVLIENLRREGYEFQVSKPMPYYKEIDGKRHEPMEKAIIDLDSDYQGRIIEKLGKRKGQLVSMETLGLTDMRLTFEIPSRGLIGFRHEFLTDTKGTGVLNTEFIGYKPYCGEMPRRVSGSLVAFETGITTAYGLFQAQKRGRLFVSPGEEVYVGEVVGENPAGLEIEVHVGREKKMTNMRAGGSDESLILTPGRDLSLEEMMEFIDVDELIEVTPHHLRMRKEILDHSKRQKNRR